MPVAEFPGDRGWGYDGVDLFAPHHAYGGPDGLKRLVDAATPAGSPCSWTSSTTTSARTATTCRASGPTSPTGTARPGATAVNFDGPGSDEVRRFVIDNALMWLRDYHVDGLRLDAVHAIVDDSATHILEELAAEVDALAARPRPAAVADRRERPERPAARPQPRGRRLRPGRALERRLPPRAPRRLTGESDGYLRGLHGPADLCRALREVYVYDGSYSPHRERPPRPAGRGPAAPSSSATSRTTTRSATGPPASGAPLAGSRRAPRGRRARAAAAPFVPMLFQGEEWGASTPFQYFTDHSDPALGRAVSEGRRRGVRRLRLGPGRRARSAGSGDVRARPGSTGPSRDAIRTPTCCAWYRELIALAAADSRR